VPPAYEVILAYSALLSFIRRLFSSTPADDLAEANSEEAATSSMPMSDLELARTIKELRESSVADEAFRAGRAGREKNGGDR
jgi:hypothetical protein